MEGVPGIVIENEHPFRSVDAEVFRHVLAAVLEGESKLLESLVVVLSDHGSVHDLNRRYLGHDYETDVLAFSYAEGDEVDGEIYVDLDTAEERHAEFHASFEEEAFRYAVHGLLHLIGYSDKSEDGKEQMRMLEDRYVERFRSLKRGRSE